MKTAADAKGELESRIHTLETENNETSEQLVDAYSRIKSEESARDKAKEALSIAMSLLSGEVDTGDDGNSIQPDA